VKEKLWSGWEDIARPKKYIILVKNEKKGGMREELGVGLEINNGDELKIRRETTILTLEFGRSISSSAAKDTRMVKASIGAHPGNVNVIRKLVRGCCCTTCQQVQFVSSELSLLQSCFYLEIPGFGGMGKHGITDSILKQKSTIKVQTTCEARYAKSHYHGLSSFLVRPDKMLSSCTCLRVFPLTSDGGYLTCANIEKKVGIPGGDSECFWRKI
jgi:hypothetical protein